MILYMKRIQAIGILAFLFTLVGCDKYNDELLTDVEVEEYGYIQSEIRDEYDNCSFCENIESYIDRI